jgi:hypothetical protein
VGDDGMTRRHKQRNRTKIAKKGEQHPPKKEVAKPQAANQKDKASVESNDK